MGNSDYLFLAKGYELNPNEVSKEHFCLLTEIAPIYSKKVIKALEDYLVHGDSRRVACERSGVSLGYFSTSLARLQKVSFAVELMAEFYSKKIN